MIRWSIAIVIVLALFLAGCAESHPGRVGVVTAAVFFTADGTGLTLVPGRPVAGAEVRVANAGVRALTNAAGQVTLSSVPLGAQTVFLSYPGLSTFTVPVIVQPGLTPLTGTPVAVTRRWTVLIFMNGNNDLEPNGVDNLNQLESAPDSAAVTTVVQFARSPEFDASNGNWTGARRIEVHHDADPTTLTSPTVEDLGDADMGQAATLRAFLAWGAARYPSERRLLVIWNHGSGWKSRLPAGAITRGISFDDVHHSFIRTQELPAALAGTTLDVVAFDASLMQMLEVAYEIRTTAPYIVGSEESPPAPGYPYDRIQRALVSSPTMPPREAAILFARETLVAYGPTSNITQSVLDTGKLDALAGALDGLAGALLPHAVPDAVALATVRDATEHYAQLEYKDLADYAAQVKAALPDTTGAADAVIAAVGQAVIAEVHGAAHARSRGVSIYVPSPDAYSTFAAGYATLALSQRTRWPDFLASQAR
jgi:hypothetical protein